MSTRVYVGLGSNVDRETRLLETGGRGPTREFRIVLPAAETFLLGGGRD